MKQLLLSTVAALSLALPAAARDTVVALSPFGPQAERQAQLEQVMHHLLETLDPGETALFFDGYEARRLGAFVVPTKSGYERARAKLAANAEVMGQLKRFLDTKRSDGFAGQLDLPEVLAAIAESYPAQSPADLILLGSPLYEDALAPRGRVVSGLINGPVRLRLTWGCEGCDLDLYVKLPQGDVISFRNPSSMQGQLYKDQRSSPSLSNGYETVALTGDVDLSKLEVLVNFHTGAAPQGVQGVIEVEAANTEARQIPFQIDTVSGNRGQDHDVVLRTGDLSPAWARVDLSTLEE